MSVTGSAARDPRLFLVLLPLGAACDDTPAAAPDTGTPDAAIVEVDVLTAPELPGEHVPPQTQREGDPARGFEVLARGAYVGCGIPADLIPIAQDAGMLGEDPPLPGRDEALPYYLSRFTTASGVEVVGPNCMICHAGVGVDGQVVVGLPGIDLDFGGFASQISGFESQIGALAGLLAPESYAELVKFADRLSTIAPYVQTEVQGVNPADNLAGILFSHRDRDTLAWSEEPLIDPPPPIVAPVDPPPWWRMKKKSTMFYTALGRGDHGRIMMTASTLCVDTVEDARAIDADFGHVRAYIASLEAPRWPEEILGTIDPELARRGQGLFEANCSQCHGTYGESGGATRDDDTYPNLWVTLDEIGTDPILAVGASHVAERFVDWFNDSFYGETAWLDPQRGYVPPPLDGVWATAPYLHNGSVPTLAQVLDSTARPTYWRRQAGFDATSVGLPHQVVDVGHDQIPGPGRRTVYDTTLIGYGNGGHDFADHLDEAQRTALIEYLKTL